MTAMTQSEYARHAGVNRSTVHRWLEAGRIQARPDGLIDPVEADRMREATESPLPHHQARKAQIEAEKAAAASAGPGPYQPTTQAPTTQHGATAGQSEGNTADTLTRDDVNHRKNVAAMKEREWTAVQRETEARRAAGELCSLAKVQESWRSAFVILRTTMEAIPARAAPVMAACKGEIPAMERELEALVGDALKECADTFKRRMEYPA